MPYKYVDRNKKGVAIIRRPFFAEHFAAVAEGGGT